MSEGTAPGETLDGDQLYADALKDGFILDDWEVNTSPFSKNEVDSDLPWGDVEASRRNRWLQKNRRLPRGIRSHFAEARPCPQCQSPAEALSWFYFRSPKETWAQECGVAGWMAVCDRCRVQVNFFIEAVS
jgi:hypothetical protein